MDSKLKEKYIRHGCGSVVEIIEKLEAQVPKWISVEDRLPGDSVECLVIDYAGYYHLADYVVGGWCETTEGLELDAITHWMPLPEPPEGDTNE